MLLLTIKRVLKHLLSQVFVDLLLAVESRPIRLRERNRLNLGQISSALLISFRLRARCGGVAGWNTFVHLQ